MPPLLADFTHARPCKPKCEKYLTLPIKKAGFAKLPSAEKLKAELNGLAARKTALQEEFQKIQREEREYDMLRQNVDILLERPKEQEQQRQRDNNLE